MRLKDITELARNFKESFANIKEWPEVQLSDSLKKDLLSLFPVSKGYKNTAIVSTGDANIIIFPNQYFLMSVLIRPLVDQIKEYNLLLDQLILDCRTQNIDLAKIIDEKDKGKTSPDVVKFDSLMLSKTYLESNGVLLIKFLVDEKYRLKSKSISNFNKNKYKLRGTDDFFGSFFLQIVNLPNASSAVFGDIVFKLSDNPVVYDRLCEELRPKLPFLLKEKTLNNFVFFSFLFLINEKKLDLFLPYLKANSDTKFYSIEFNSYKLTSVFWCFDHLATPTELTQGTKIRCFDEPLFIKDGMFYYLSTEWSHTGESRLDFDVYRKIFNEICNELYYIEEVDGYFYLKSKGIKKYSINTPEILSIKTKPFIILAGISGTGKSRLVRKLAYQFNNIPTDKTENKNPPTNYQLIKVKPNWHDSSEVLGYESRINGDRYIVTEFIRFIVKAWQYPQTPFFLCLDEMNLAPVEQYFAEYLSVLETREWKESESTIHSDDIINKSVFEYYSIKRDGHDSKYDFWNELRLTDDKLKQQFIEKGLTLPPNLIVMGTVNMDETTHSFSRKVLDRAMTIEMNQIDLKNNLETAADELKYPATPMDSNLVLAERTHGHQVYEDLGAEADTLIAYLEEINIELDNTPFRVAYRVRDEFLLYAYNYMQHGNTQDDWLNSVMDEMTCMKILPRIEGDEEKTEVINKLIKIFKDRGLKRSLAKAEEMEFRRTKYHYTSFWN